MNERERQHPLNQIPEHIPLLRIFRKPAYSPALLPPQPRARVRKNLLFLLALTCGIQVSFAQARFPKSAPQPTRILFVFDASFSMYGTWQSGRKIDLAKTMLSSFLDSLKNISNLEVGLRCYGHQSDLYPQRNCQDTKLEVPIAKSSASIPAIQNKLSGIVPKGTTPIAYTLEQCGNDFPDATTRNIIILITDGIEECDGDPCAVSLALQKKGIILKPFVIGVGLGNIASLGCIGKYFDVSSEANFTQVLDYVISQALDNTTAQVNLLDQGGSPSETDVTMTFYDQTSGAVRYDYMHTLNNRGLPDTLVLDPLSTYKMVVHTIPPVEKSNITIIPGKHNIIGVDAPQGKLTLSVNGVSNYPSLSAIVRKHGSCEAINVQDFNKTQKYIVGKYDLEILTLPRIKMDNIDVGQSKTTSIQIPNSGVVNLYKPSDGPGQILLEENNKLTWVCDLSSSLIQENIVLQPGKYRVVWRSSTVKQTAFTVEKKFTITSGVQTPVKLY